MAVIHQSVVYTVHTDHLSTPRAISDAQGVVVWRWEGEPFGATAADEDPDGVEFVYNGRFAGQYFDPSAGRYITSDPIGLKGGLNTYGYAISNPIRFKDSLGLDVTIKINRDTYTNESITGTISVESDAECSDSFSGYTLEDIWAGIYGVKDPIPPGTYNAHVRGNRIELEGVLGYSYIQIHIGNSAEDVEGCFAVGTTRGENFVGNSATPMDAILDIIEKDGTRNITVQDSGSNIGPPSIWGF